MIAYEKVDGVDHLLMSCVEGYNLAELAKDWKPTEIAKKFARAVKRFHQLDLKSVFSEKFDDGLVVLHGDMSLPNVIRDNDGQLGYIDLAQMSVGSPDSDLADAIWSLQRNLGPDYGNIFLEEYGVVEMTEKIEKALRFRYLPK